MRRRRPGRGTSRRTTPGVGRVHLVPLMDIFTILVFFLLVNTSEVQHPGAGLRLPAGRAERPPGPALVVTVTPELILVEDQPVVRVAELAPGDGPIAPLAAALRRQATPGGEGTATVAGDRDIPFRLLRRVMRTLAESGHPDVSLAVIRREDGT